MRLEQWLVNVPGRMVIKHLFNHQQNVGEKFVELRAVKELVMEKPKV